MVVGEPRIPDYYRNAIEKIKGEVRSKDDSFIVGVDLDEYANYLFEDYALPEIEIDEGRERTIQKIKESQTYNKEIVKAKITIFFKPRHNLEWSLKLRPSAAYVHIFPIKIQGASVTLETLAKESDINSELRMFSEEIENKNKEIEPQNQQLKQQIYEIVKQRQEKIQEEEEKFEALIEKINIPLTRREGVVIPDSTTLRVAEQYRTITPPTVTKKTEPTLEREKVNAVIQLIEGCCRSWELSPKTYQKFEEEELRDIILSSLNTVFQGGATGETFSKRGKTDIYLSIPSGNILIAECKFWDGAHKFQEAIDQILTYLTWRNSYGIVIIFSKNKGFTEVLETILNEIPKHPQYKKGLDKIDTTHFVSYNSLPEDERKLVELHYLSYNLYT